MVFALGALLLGAGAVWALHVRAQWIERKVTAALVKQPATAHPIPSCNRNGQDIVIIGDSRVARWPMRFFKDLSVVNEGIGGETALQLASRFQRDVFACRPQAVLIAAGINDLIAASLASADQAREIVDRLPSLLITLAEEAAQAGATVTIATIVPPARPNLLRRLTWSDSVRGYVRQVNARLRVYPWTGTMTLVDFAAALDPDETGILPDRFRRDTLHLGAGAYACLTPMLPFVSSHTASPPPACANINMGSASRLRGPID